MRQKTSFSRGIFSNVSMIILFVLFIVSCNKNSLEKEKTQNEIMEEYKQTLYNDKDFIENYKIDRILTNINTNKDLILDDTKINSLLKSLEKTRSSEELKFAFSSHGYSNSAELVRLFDLKATALNNIQKKFPYLSHLQKEELNELFVYSYERVIIDTKSTVHKPGCSNNCCDAYVDGIDDCDTDFAIATGFALFGGGLAAIFGTPIAGAAAVSTGIGAAYLMHERCAATTARTYRQCMGYPR
jgi:hypothetical protein